ncbi:hypothetical protein M885DRAFT_523830 [Pelagophyceae sp. CCMP2097]|nr:hypothetical protein M885DRAFT_523830 [Pelagophyceae sp. CCMP2097]
MEVEGAEPAANAWDGALPIMDPSEDRTWPEYVPVLGAAPGSVIQHQPARAKRPAFEEDKLKRDANIQSALGTLAKDEQRLMAAQLSREFAKLSFGGKFSSLLNECIKPSTALENNGEAANLYARVGVGDYDHLHKESLKAWDKLHDCIELKAMQKDVALRIAAQRHSSDGKVHPTKPRKPKKGPKNEEGSGSDVLKIVPPTVNKNNEPVTVGEYRKAILKRWRKADEAAGHPAHAYSGGAAAGTHFLALRISPVVKITVYDNRDTLEHFEWQGKERQTANKAIASILKVRSGHSSRCRDKRWVWADHEEFMASDGFVDEAKWIDEKKPVKADKVPRRASFGKP